MKGKTKSLDLQNPLNRCKFEGLRLIQGNNSGNGPFHRLNEHGEGQD